MGDTSLETDSGTAEVRSHIGGRLRTIEDIARELDLADGDRLRDWSYVNEVFLT